MYFVCRWREESPFGKRVVAVPDATVLDWSRRGWGRDDPEEWITAELGGDVYGLESILEEARERRLPPPETVDELRALLDAHLWVEGDDEGSFIRLGTHTLRVRTTTTRWIWPTTSSTTTPPPRRPTGSRPRCTTPGRCPPGPPVPTRSSATTCRSAPSTTPRPVRRRSSRFGSAGIRRARRATWI
nr:hypothetical protein [Micromonospora tarensis]